MSPNFLLWILAAIGVYSILRWTMAVQLKPAGEIVRKKAMEPAMPYVPVRVGYKVRALNPKDIPEVVTVQQITANVHGIPELLFFRGLDGSEGVCHASKAQLVGVIPPAGGYLRGDFIRMLPLSPLLKVEFVIPHADPRVVQLHCVDRYNQPVVCLAGDAVPAQT